MINLSKAIAAALILIASAPAALASQCFASNPLQSMTVTSAFGQRLHPKLKVWKCHCGVDLRAQTPLPLYAVGPGKVTASNFHHGGGNIVELRLDSGIVVKYMHLSNTIRQKGDRVNAGDVVGTSGNTGEWTTGPHLHFVSVVNNNPVDPLQFVCGGGVSTAAGAALPPAPAGQPDPNAPVPAGAGATGISTPPVQTFPSMDQMSVRDFLYTETHKRFGNPQWHQEMAHPGAMQMIDPKATAQPADALTYPKLYYLREMNSMLALRGLMKYEDILHKQEVQGQLAALLSIDARNYSDKILKITRESLSAR